MFREALAIQLRTLEPDHPKTPDTYYNLAVSLREQGRLAEAQAEFRAAIAAAERAFGPDHALVAKYRRNLDGVLRRAK